MNKNIIKLFAILMMCFLIGSVLVACGSTNEDDQDVFSIEIVDGKWVINGVKTDVQAVGKDGQTGPAGTPGQNLTNTCTTNHDYNIYDDKGNIAEKDGNKWVINSHAHDCVPSRVTGAEKPATCTTDGYYTETCNCPRGILWVCVDCGEAKFQWTADKTWKVTVEAFGHDFKDGAYTDPTCSAKGYTTCVNGCGTKQVDEVTPLADHTPSAKQDVKPEAGLKYCVCTWNYPWFIACTECDEVLERGEYGVAHDGVGTAENPHVWGNHEIIKPDAGVNPCTWLKDSKKASCLNCDCHEDYIYGTEQKGHKEQEYKTHTINGDVLTLSYKCDDCGENVDKVLSLAACTEEKDSTCSEEGYSKITYEYYVNGEKKTYTVKDEVIAKKPHTAEDVTGGAPSCDEAGLSTGKKCSVCNVTLVEQHEVPAIGHNGGAGKAGAEKETIVVVGGIEYDAYWCDVCNAWIAYQKHVED